MNESHRRLRNYLFSMLQTTEYMVGKGMTLGKSAGKNASLP